MQSIYIDDEQLRKLRGVMTPNAWLVFWLTSETGMRVGDAVSLAWDGVSYCEIVFVAQKTKKAAHAKISAELYGALRARRTASPWVFPSPKDPRKHLTRQAVWYRIKKACDRVGLDPEGISPHSMRKHFAVETFKRSGLKATQEALQHDRAITTEIYALSDFSTGQNAEKPLLRRDLDLIVKLCAAALGLRVDK